MSEKTAVKHVWFETQLTNASGVKSLRVAAPQWELSHFDRTQTGYEHCQLCHNRIQAVVVIQNPKNGVLLRIGEDCYEILLNYLKTERIEAIRLMSRTEHARQVKDYIVQELGGNKRIIAAMTAWLDAQPELPKTVAQTLVFIKLQRFAPSLEAARELVAYYKAHRKIALSDFLTKEEQQFAQECIHCHLLPREVLLGDIPRFRDILQQLRQAKSKRLAKRQRKLMAQHLHDIKEVMPKGLRLAECALTNITGYYQKPGGGKKAGRNFNIEFRYHEWPYAFYLHVTEKGRNLVTEVNESDVRASIPDTVRLTSIYALVNSDEFWGPYAVALRLDPADNQKWAEQAKAVRDQRLIQRRTDAYAAIERCVEQFPDLYLKCSFRQGLHPRGGTEQWEASVGGKKFVLTYDDFYTEKEGNVYVKVVHELASRRVYLVTRLFLDEISLSSGWYYYRGKPRFRQSLNLE